VPGVEIRLARSAAPGRRTAYTLVLVRKEGEWVCLVPALANRIVETALSRASIGCLAGAKVLGREVPKGRSRLDFLLSFRGSPVLTEVKSVSLVSGRRALFPDAPTERGARHLHELAGRCRRGGKSLVVFVVQRSDASSVSPNRGTDPVFGRALDEAAAAGVGMLAFTCRITPRGCYLARSIPVVL